MRIITLGLAFILGGQLMAQAPADLIERMQNYNQTTGKYLNYDISLPIWELNAEQMQLNADEALTVANRRLDAIVNLAEDEISFTTVIEELEDIYYDVGLVENRIGIISATSLDQAMRNKANDMEVAFANWYVEVSARKDLYQVVQKVAQNAPPLRGEAKKLLDDTIRDYKRSGFHLPQEVQQQVVQLQKDLSTLTSEIDKNIKNANGVKVSFTLDELAGLSSDDLSALEKIDENTYAAATGVSYQMFAVISNAKDEQVRKKAFLARSSRAKKTNEPLIKEVILKRAQLATLLGYATYADYITETRMAQTGQTALDFVNSLIEGLDGKFTAELNSLRTLKVRETKDSNAEIKAWDVSYYTQILEKENYSLDLSGLKKYFEYEKTLRGMFDVFSHIFKLEINFISAPYTWAPDVKLVQIKDAQTQKILGHLYLDMFPRPEEDKYGHFAMFTIRSGRYDHKTGLEVRPIAALICNFPKATIGRPSLLSYDNVKTLFHEFGHALHGIVTTAHYASFAGTRVPRDFVEAPSQMLEYWVADKRVLDLFAVNYQDPSDRFPQDVLEKIARAEKATIGMAYRRQLAFGKMDLLLHHEAKDLQNLDPIAVSNSVLNEVFLAYPEGSSFLTAFGHLFGGYAAGYYGYAWSDNVAADMASIFEQSPQGFLDEEIGMRLRREIYQVGGSRDIHQSIESFLGRPTNNQAFLRKLGIE